MYLYNNNNYDNNIKYDKLREYCLCENVNEELMRSNISQNHQDAGGYTEREKIRTDEEKYSYTGFLFYCFSLFKKYWVKLAAKSPI